MNIVIKRTKPHKEYHNHKLDVVFLVVLSIGVHFLDKGAHK